MPGCPELVDGGGRCDEHKSEYRRKQAQRRRDEGDPSYVFYASARWRTVRASYLRRHPTCIGCGAKATVVDHEPPRKQLVAEGIHDPEHDRWLRPLCMNCHNRKTATTDGGFGRQSLPVDER